MMDSLIFSSIGLYTVVLYIFGRKTTMAQCIFNRKREGGRSIAIYHCSIKIISRDKGKSAVAAAAYRAGETITNEYDGITHDYTRKGGVVHTEILLSDNAPAEYSDRAVLWNAVEKIEKAKNSQLAREIELALPVELTLLQNKSLVREYVKKHFTQQGMCADIAIHDTGGGNPHAHIMLTMRPFTEEKTWGDKQKKEYILDSQGEKIYDKKKRSYKCKSVPTTDWNEQTKAEEWRSGWADSVNRYLEKLNHSERVDHRSYERQSIEQIPTVHLGVAAFQMEKRGNLNREIEVTNQRLWQLKARIAKLQNWLKEESENIAPLTLADVIQGILSRREQQGGSGYYQSIGNLKAAAKMFNFLQENQIMDMAGLDDCFGGMIGRQQDIQDELKPIDRRLKTLDEHIRHSGNYKGYRGQKALDTTNEYYETYRNEITMYDNAEKYLRDVLQKHFDPKKLPPITKWKAERDKLTAERNKLNQRYISLKDEVKEAEKIRKSVDTIMREENRRTQPKRAHDMEL